MIKITTIKNLTNSDRMKDKEGVLFTLKSKNVGLFYFCFDYWIIFKGEREIQRATMSIWNKVELIETFINMADRIENDYPINFIDDSGAKMSVVFYKYTKTYEVINRSAISKPISYD